MSPSAAPEVDPPTVLSPPVAVIANGRCPKAQAIAQKVTALGLTARLVDLDADPHEAAQFAKLFADGKARAPALVVGNRAWRNPSLAEVEKHLARSGALAPRPIHDPQQQRVVWHMPPADAFASYTRRPDGKLVFGHIQTADQLRGTGLGARLAAQLFGWLIDHALEARVTCGFLRKVAATRPEWAARFLG